VQESGASTGTALPTPDAQREALEGMPVAPAETLPVSDVYDLTRYGEVLLSSGGRLLTATEVADPGPGAQQLAVENAARSILLLDPADGTTDGTTFTATNPRPATPPTVGGDLRVADFNVLNHVVDFPGQYGADARGATNAAELARQQATIVNARAALDADVVTLHEIENPPSSPPGAPTGRWRRCCRRWRCRPGRAGPTSRHTRTPT
jgi:5'-nucleotidase